MTGVFGTTARPRRMRDGAADGGPVSRRSGREQSAEERPIALERYAQILGGHIFAAAPLPFEALALARETQGQPLQYLPHKSLGVL